jgi:hypothetical protein
LDNLPYDPTPDKCFAHQKLMFAIQKIKETIALTDSFWGLWDSMEHTQELDPVHHSLGAH